MAEPGSGIPNPTNADTNEDWATFVVQKVADGYLARVHEGLRSKRGQKMLPWIESREASNICTAYKLKYQQEPRETYLEARAARHGSGSAISSHGKGKRSDEVRKSSKLEREHRDASRVKDRGRRSSPLESRRVVRSAFAHEYERLSKLAVTTLDELGNQDPRRTEHFKQALHAFAWLLLNKTYNKQAGDLLRDYRIGARRSSEVGFPTERSPRRYGAYRPPMAEPNEARRVAPDTGTGLDFDRPPCQLRAGSGG